MSSETVKPPPPPISDGDYYLQFGHHVGVEARCLTTGKPGSQATLEHLGHPVIGNTQEFHVVYDKHEHSYSLLTDARHGVSYDKEDPNSRVIASKAFPHFFDIIEVDDIIPPPPVKVYRIRVGGEGHRKLVIGIAPETITPPLLELQSPSLGAVWQFHRVKKSEGEETGGE